MNMDKSDSYLPMKKNQRFVLLIFLYTLLIELTILFMLNDGWLDKVITSYFYNGSLPLGERFFLDNSQPWYFMNENEWVFDVTMAVFFIPLLVIGLIKIKQPKGKLLTRYSLYIIISVLISVGVLVNWVLKGLYGRPRPLHTSLFPNSDSAPMYDFFFLWEPAFLKDPSLIGVGVSFPSGHTSVTAMFSLLYYVFRNREIWKQMTPNKSKMSSFIYIATRIFKWLGFAIGTVGSVIMGLSRIIAGKHFASDTMYSIAIVWTISWIFYRYVFRIPQKESILLNGV
jgi:membrane-associated phospholipid phosphatase